MSGEKPLNWLKAILGFSRRRWNAFTDLRKIRAGGECNDGPQTQDSGGEGVVSEIAKRYGVTQNTVYCWRRMCLRRVQESLPSAT